MSEAFLSAALIFSSSIFLLFTLHRSAAVQLVVPLNAFLPSFGTGFLFVVHVIIKKHNLVLMVFCAMCTEQANVSSLSDYHCHLLR